MYRAVTVLILYNEPAFGTYPAGIYAAVEIVQPQRNPWRFPEIAAEYPDDSRRGCIYLIQFLSRAYIHGVINPVYYRLGF